MSRIMEMLAYEPVNYKYRDNKIEVAGALGFTLIKNSYFLYWTGKNKIMLTTQCFMLTYSKSGDILLEYTKPFLNLATAIISLVFLAGIVGAIIYPSPKRWQQLSNSISNKERKGEQQSEKWDSANLSYDSYDMRV